MTEQKPPMGPPEEMKQLAYLIGDWEATGKVMIDPSKQEWVDYNATMRYEWMFNGGAIRGDHSGSLIGMTYRGHLIIPYDREKKEWQSAWMDDIACRQSIHTGAYENGAMVVEGDDIRTGASLRMRITTARKSDTELDWKMEMSADGGATWMTTSTAVYRKK